MLNIERRITALEATQPPEDITMLLRFVNCEEMDAELHGLDDNKGARWIRQPDETEQDLIDRATREVKRNVLGMAFLQSADAEKTNADH